MPSSLTLLPIASLSFIIQKKTKKQLKTLFMNPCLCGLLLLLLVPSAVVVLLLFIHFSLMLQTDGDFVLLQVPSIRFH